MKIERILTPYRIVYDLELVYFGQTIYGGTFDTYKEALAHGLLILSNQKLLSVTYVEILMRVHIFLIKFRSNFIIFSRTASFNAARRVPNKS